MSAYFTMAASTSLIERFLIYRWIQSFSDNERFTTIYTIKKRCLHPLLTELAGITGLEPVKYRSQSPAPYLLGYIPMLNFLHCKHNFIIFIFFYYPAHYGLSCFNLSCYSFLRITFIV